MDDDQKEARTEGYNVFMDGKKVEDNPYAEDALFQSWKEGYYDAAWDM